MKKVIYAITVFAMLSFCLGLFSCATAPRSQSQQEQERETAASQANQNRFWGNPGFY